MEVGKRPVPPDAMVKWIGGGDYLELGARQRELMIHLGGLEPTHEVLDVGCGCGRTATALRDFLIGPGSYRGLDNSPEMIGWCAANIQNSGANFQFDCADVYNGYYNVRGRIESRVFKFPYQDESFDFVCLWSVFTHMVPGDVQNYLREIFRVLASNGTCFFTAFLINDESEQLIKDSKSTLPICHPYGDAYLAYVENIEGAIGYRPETLLAWAKEAGFELKSGPIYGNWCGREAGGDYQDIIVLYKP